MVPTVLIALPHSGQTSFVNDRYSRTTKTGRPSSAKGRNPVQSPYPQAGNTTRKAMNQRNLLAPRLRTTFPCVWFIVITSVCMVSRYTRFRVLLPDNTPPPRSGQLLSKNSATAFSIRYSTPEISRKMARVCARHFVGWISLLGSFLKSSLKCSYAVRTFSNMGDPCRLHSNE